MLVDGVDGQTPDYIRRTWPTALKNPAFLKPGHLCCTTGHMTMLIRFLATGADCAVICEDDVDFRSPLLKFQEALGAALERYGSGWGWINFVGWECEPPVIFPDGHEHHWTGGGLHRAGKAAWCNMCYAVTRHGAITLLDRAMPQSESTDYYTRHANGAIVLQAGPSLAGALPVSSFILNEHTKTTIPAAEPTTRPEDSPATIFH